MRNQIISLAVEIGNANQKPCIICGGHGPISVISDGKMVNMNGVENVILI